MVDNFVLSTRESMALLSSCERCSLDSRTGFEVFAPGRQSMASAMNPVFRSANLIRRTVSHRCCRRHPRWFHVLRPNQALELTLSRRETHFNVVKQFIAFAALGYTKGGSAYSR